MQTSLCCTLCNSGGGRKGPLGLRGGDTWVRDEHMLLRSVMKKGGGLERVACERVLKGEGSLCSRAL